MGKEELMTAPTLSRKEELFEQFLQLLFEHCKEQHVVTFYAEKLFITPQYLSLILKELTGKSANKWIDDALIVEAKMLLKAPQATVQQVADILHFSDQSTFGKSQEAYGYTHGIPEIIIRYFLYACGNLYQLINSQAP